MDNITTYITDKINSLHLERVRVSTIEKQPEGHYLITIYGGLNGYGKWTDYLKQLEAIIESLSGSWLIDLENDYADDSWKLRIGFKPGYTSTFKGTIIITDPCYVIKNEDWEDSKYGKYLNHLGFNHYITKPTIYGDWGCTTYQTNSKNTLQKIIELRTLYNNAEKEVPEEKLEELDNAFEMLENIIYEQQTKAIGAFCADAGMVSVFLLDEVLTYNPDFEQWAKEHSWCVTIIKDFEGDIRYYVDEFKQAHIIGKGSIDFFTMQTSL